MAAILPGATLGILGGGQLGRMTAMAARSLGYHIWALDPDASCASRFVVERCITAGFNDVAAATELAKHCNVVTLEIEQIAIECLQSVENFVPMRPGAFVLSKIQDRAVQKQWLQTNGFPLAPWRLATDIPTLEKAIQDFQSNCFVKATVGGYDGKGQIRIKPSDAITTDAAWQSIGSRSCVIEQAIDLLAEVSVMVARQPSGRTAVFPTALNHHENQILDWSVIPCPLDAKINQQAEYLAREIANQMKIEGLLAIEMFVTRDQQVLVNELAPRPHNTFHATELACATSQFEQLVRAVCDLPLGSVEVLRPAAIVNLLGDLWLDHTPPAFDKALALEGVRLHLYGKRQARPGRKMGHLSAIGHTPEQAVERVLQARKLLTAHAQANQVLPR